MDLLDKNFRTTVLNMLKELKENMDNELEKTRKTIKDQNESINKETVIIKRNQILELKSTITK